MKIILQMMISWKSRWSVQIRRTKEDLRNVEREGMRVQQHCHDQIISRPPETPDGEKQEIIRVSRITLVMPPGPSTRADLRQTFSRISGSTGTRTGADKVTGSGGRDSMMIGGIETGAGEAEAEASPGYKQ